jgi:hypothetical protein
VDTATGRRFGSRGMGSKQRLVNERFTEATCGGRRFMRFTAQIAP